MYEQIKELLMLASYEHKLRFLFEYTMRNYVSVNLDGEIHGFGGRYSEKATTIVYYFNSQKNLNGDGLFLRAYSLSDPSIDAWGVQVDERLPDEYRKFLKFDQDKGNSQSEVFERFFWERWDNSSGKMETSYKSKNRIPEQLTGTSSILKTNPNPEEQFINDVVETLL
jgi:hypothetical protein